MLRQSSPGALLFVLFATAASGCATLLGLDQYSNLCGGLVDAPDTCLTGSGGHGGSAASSSSTGNGGAGGGGGIAGGGGGGGLPAHCSDHAHDGGETDVDCGGDCAACANGKGCQKAADCVSNTCKLHKCVPAGCNTSDDCPMGQACNLSTHVCSTTCDGDTETCNGGCCVNATCAPGTQEGACGSGGLLCATSCVLGACSQVPEFGAGSCECGDASHCVGVATGHKCVGQPGSGVCGCLGSSDCDAGHTCKLVGLQGFSAGYCE